MDPLRAVAPFVALSVERSAAGRELTVAAKAAWSGEFRIAERDLRAFLTAHRDAYFVVFDAADQWGLVEAQLAATLDSPVAAAAGPDHGLRDWWWEVVNHTRMACVRVEGGGMIFGLGYSVQFFFLFCCNRIV